MSDGAERERNFKFVGGQLCMDFVNTVGNYHDPLRLTDYFASYADLVAWSRQAGVITDPEARTLRREAEFRPAEAAAVLTRAVELRDAIRGVALATAHGHPAEADDLARLNAFVGELLASMRLVPTDEGFVLGRDDDPTALDRVLWPIVRSAIDLFTSGELGRVRECAGDACGWVFVDTSRSGRRRWCDMADCGNTAKVRRYRARHAGTAA